MIAITMASVKMVSASVIVASLAQHVQWRHAPMNVLFMESATMGYVRAMPGLRAQIAVRSNVQITAMPLFSMGFV